MNLITKIDSEGFVFDNFLPNNTIYNEILNSEYPSEMVHDFFLSEIESRVGKVNNIHLVYEDIFKSNFHENHTHLIPADFQVVVWVPKESYEGRAFIYGSPGKTSKFYPQFGDICFMKTNDLNFIHGVEPLKSDTMVRTLLISVNCNGYLGEHLTVSANELKPI